MSRRSRNIKPDLYMDEVLGEADPAITLTFTGLWCLADKEGRLKNNPKRIKAEIHPYRKADVAEHVKFLNEHGFIETYEAEGGGFIQVSDWKKHQNPHHKERPSEIPPPPSFKHDTSMAQAKVKHGSSITQARPLIPDSGYLIPDSSSLIPDSNSDSGASMMHEERFEVPVFQQVYEEMLINNVEEPTARREARRYLDYYTSVNWVVGEHKKPMRDWQASVRSWKPNEERPSPAQDIVAKHMDRSWAD